MTHRSPDQELAHADAAYCRAEDRRAQREADLRNALVDSAIIENRDKPARDIRDAILRALDAEGFTIKRRR